VSSALKVAWVLSLLLLIVTGAVGIYNGVTEWGEGHTPLEHSVTAGVFLYGLFGLSSAAGLVRREPWSLKPAIGWAITVTCVPPAAIMAYGGPDQIGPAVAAALGSGLIASGVLWTAHQATKRSLAAVG
jgi:hypothetical protein